MKGKSTCSRCFVGSSQLNLVTEKVQLESEIYIEGKRMGWTWIGNDLKANT